MTETAVIVPVPAAEPLLCPHRRGLDHSAALGVPAHVTVLYPFVPPDRLETTVVENLRAVIAGVPAFDCVFGRVEWFDEDAVWLAPEPADPFLALTNAVWERFPECPPYEGAHPVVVPHLTIGSTRVGELAALRRAAAEVRTGLPVRARIDRALLITGTDAPGSWHTLTELPLGDAGTR